MDFITLLCVVPEKTLIANGILFIKGVKDNLTHEQYTGAIQKIDLKANLNNRALDGGES